MSQAISDEVFDQLKPHTPRAYVSDNANLTDKDTVVELYTRLLRREISSFGEFERWILNRSELDAAVSQAGAMLYIKMTCQTDDESRSKAYSDFMQNVSPAIKTIDDKLNRKFLECLEQYPLDHKRYEVMIREIRECVELFREDNVELQTQVQMLSQEYQSVCGAMTVQFDGEEKTMPQMGKYLQDPDRNLRERAWRAMAERRAQDRDRLDEIFNKMKILRNQIAANADCKDFAEYQFKAYGRFDYTREQCKQFHQTAKELLVPLWKEIQAKRTKLLGFESLHPWDTAVDPTGKPPLKPFEEAQELVEKTYMVFKNVDEELAQQFAKMRDAGLLDLASRKGKAPGGYQYTLSEARTPFIFMNAVGVDSDVRTLLHEGGHAFHAIACADDPINDYRHAPMEYCEVASMAMELLAGEHLDVFYNEEDYKRSRKEHFEDIIKTLIWVANIDAFQFWMYENPDHTNEERTAKWVELVREFSGDDIDWSGVEHYREALWHRQLHIFEVPFYYIEYAIAQLGALQIWVKSKTNYADALAGYKNGLKLGGSRPLPELYASTGIKFDFSKEIILPLVEQVKQQWEALS